MRVFVSSIFGLLLLLLVGVVTAQTPTLTISPDEVPLGTSFNITGSDLEPNSTYTLSVIQDSTDESVYDTEVTSNASGRIALNLSTDAETDVPGAYRIEVRDGETVVAEAEFELQSDADPTSEPSGSESGEGSVNVFPAEGVSGTSFDILISGLAAGETAEVIIEGPEGSEVYTTSRTIADDGTAEISIFTEDSDGPGTYVVIVNSGDVTLETTFALTAQTGQNGTVTVTPQTDDAGPSYRISIADVKPFADLTLTIEAPDSNEEIFESRVRASVDGEAHVDFKPESAMEAGTYNIVVLDRDTEVATGTLTLDEEMLALLDGPVIRISPVDADPGTLRLITISSLTAGETITIEISKGSTTVDTQEKTADANGTVALGLRTIGDDSPGEYTLRVLREDTAVATSTLTIGGAVAEQPGLTTTPGAPGGVTVTIDPSSGAVGTSYNVRIEGLAAEETITVDVIFDGESVYTVDKTADADGVVIMRLSTGPSDPTGTYTVTVLREGETLASADLEVTEAAGEPEATTEPEATAESALADNVTVTVDPVSGPQGTQHVIRIEGLAPRIDISIDLLSDGRVVFTSEKVSSAQGVIEFSIETEESDTPGDYTVNVRQGESILASTTLTIEAGTPTATPEATEEPLATQEATPEPEATTTPDATEAPSDEVSVAVDPVSGPRGTSHQVTVTGLQPEEIVSYQVTLDGETIIDQEVQSDEAGVVAFVLTSEESDPFGTYIIDIIRDGEMIASGELIVAEGEAEGTPTPDATEEPSETAGDVTVTIDPVVAVAGTSHDVTISGLPADEFALIEVEFDGEVVYSVNKRANSQGEVTLTLATTDEDERGTYAVNVVIGDEIVGSGELEVTDEVTENTGPEGQTETEEPDENTGPQGETETEEPDQPEDLSGIPTIEGELLLDESGMLDDEALEYTFDGEEGDSIIAVLSSEDFDAYLSLLGPDGEEIAYNDDFTDLDSQIGPFPLAESGEYTLVVSSYETYDEQPTGGEFTLQVYTVTLDEIAPDSPQALTFSSETQMYYFSFEGEVGDIIDISVTSESDTDTSLTLIDETGTIITSDDDSGQGYNPEIYQYPLVVTGSYTIVLSTTDTTGSAELVLQREGAATLDNEPQSVRLTSKLYSRALTYEAQEGEVVLLNVSVTAGEPIDVSITAYQGEFELMSYSSSQIPEGTVLGFEVPESGQIEIFVTGTNPGAVTVELSIDQ